MSSGRLLAKHHQEVGHLRITLQGALMPFDARIFLFPAASSGIRDSISMANGNSSKAVPLLPVASKPGRNSVFVYKEQKRLSAE